MLLQAGVRNGYLHKDYVIVGSKDIRPSESPGPNLYDLMQTWKHYNNEIYRNIQDVKKFMIMISNKLLRQHSYSWQD